jgi:hypothetical protein
MRNTLLMFSAGNSDAWVFSAIGTILTSRWTKNMKRMNCAFLRTSLKKVLFIAQRSRFIGASSAAPRWRKRKSNTPSTSAKACS